MKVPLNESWTPPLQGWLKTNTNVAVKDGDAAVAVMFKDHLAQVKFVGSCMVEASLVLVAEMKALQWVSRWQNFINRIMCVSL